MNRVQGQDTNFTWRGAKKKGSRVAQIRLEQEAGSRRGSLVNPVEESAFYSQGNGSLERVMQRVKISNLHFSKMMLAAMVSFCFVSCLTATHSK